MDNKLCKSVETSTVTGPATPEQALLTDSQLLENAYPLKDTGLIFTFSTILQC